jgi:hypothetical protein
MTKTLKFNIEDDLHTQFCMLPGKTHAEKLLLLLDDYITKQALEIDVEKFKEAVVKLHTTGAQLMEVAIDSYVLKVLEGKMVEADLRAYEHLKFLMLKNDQAQDKCYINKYTFREFIKNTTGGFSFNQEVMNRCLRLHQVEIARHHHRHGLDKNHNREKTRLGNMKNPVLQVLLTD